MSRLNLALAVSLGGASLLLAPALAEAHFMLGAPANWFTQLSDGSPQKTPPCGDEAIAGTSATGTVNVYQSGQPVSVTVTATIAHPGWWRISLRQGKASTQTIAAFPDPTPLGAAGSAQQCTPAFINNPVWSPTQPVIADKLGMPAGSTSTTITQSGTQTFMVTIPASAQCSAASPCTLQVLMIMTDHPAGSCNYHHCADMAPAGGATDGGTTTGTGGANGTGGARGTGGTPGDAGSTTGTGGSTAGGGGSNGVAGASGSAGSTGTAGASGVAGASGGLAGNTGAGGADTTGGGLSDNGGCTCTVGHAAAPSALGIGLAMAALLARRRRHRR